MDEYGMNRVALDPLHEREVAARRGEVRGLVAHVSAYVVVCGALAAVNLLASPGYLWFIWPLFGWGIGVASHVAGVLGMGGSHGGCHRRGPTRVSVGDHGEVTTTRFAVASVAGRYSTSRAIWYHRPMTAQDGGDERRGSDGLRGDRLS